jgi:hypothetical protein
MFQPFQPALDAFQPTLDALQPTLDAFDFGFKQRPKVIEPVGYVGTEIVNSFIEVSDAAILKVDPEQVPTGDYGDLRPTGKDGIHGILSLWVVYQNGGLSPEKREG